MLHCFHLYWELVINKFRLNGAFTKFFETLYGGIIVF